MALRIIRRACTIKWTDFYYDKRRRKSIANPKHACYLSRRTGAFPSGWTPGIVAALDKAGFSSRVVDMREGAHSFFQFGRPAMHLRDYQIEASDAALAKGRGIIHHATGSGKTVTAAVTIQKICRRTIYFVPNRTLLAQTARDLAEIIPSEYIGRCGDGKWEPHKPLVVCTAQILWKRKDTPDVRNLLSNAGCIIIDECHHVAKSPNANGNTWYRLVQMSDAWYRIGFTATPGKDDGAGRRLLEAATGRVISSVGTDELVERGILSRPAVEFYEIFVRNPTNRRAPWHEKYEQDLLGNTRRNAMIAKMAQEEMKTGRSVLISVERVARHGTVLHDSIPGSVFLHGKSTAQERASVIEAFEKKRILCIVGTILGEGVNIPSLDTLIIAGGMKSDKMTVQRIGRVLREGGGKRARIIDFFDNDSSTLMRHSMSRLKVCASRKTFDVTVITDPENTTGARPYMAVDNVTIQDRAPSLVNLSPDGEQSQDPVGLPRTQRRKPKVRRPLPMPPVR